MAHPTQYFIENRAWRACSLDDTKDLEANETTSLGSSFTDDCTDDSEVEYWGRYGNAPVYNPSSFRRAEDPADYDSYWDQYENMGSETPPLREETCKQSVMNTTISIEAPAEFRSDMHPHNQIPTCKPIQSNLNPQDLASILTQKLQGILLEEQENAQMGINTHPKTPHHLGQ
ncbi:hypothetical protein K493DRAFT_341107 [Basidiobolus meristosporus CBS 931.73]|uniref:Uncharacterized protein n=1 Tax=Basidiobolus meristosporus CBS 931.73 TaxID=1314790 RepID=A0A1Y1XSK1_9FUNG|nr:hypothetical protein K493DRAFT_341107 [Basidiobolus meristosporus CBS 931.73]|eukprot:ORX88737.1 hypothetical protein K493DRAFT_341107 [Basidiobolus meristosporus CBS 931.73]